MRALLSMHVLCQDNVLNLSIALVASSMDSNPNRTKQTHQQPVDKTMLQNIRCSLGNMLPWISFNSHLCRSLVTHFSSRCHLPRLIDVAGRHMGWNTTLHPPPTPQHTYTHIHRYIHINNYSLIPWQHHYGSQMRHCIEMLNTQFVNQRFNWLVVVVVGFYINLKFIHWKCCSLFGVVFCFFFVYLLDSISVSIASPFR